MAGDTQSDFDLVMVTNEFNRQLVVCDTLSDFSIKTDDSETGRHPLKSLVTRNFSNMFKSQRLAILEENRWSLVTIH